MEENLSALQLPSGVPELNRAIASFQKGDYEQCLKHLQDAAKKRNDLLPPRLILAKLFVQHNQLGRGLAALEDVAVESPHHPELYLTFGRLALRQGRLTDARLHFDKALELSRTGLWTEEQQLSFRGDAYDGLAGVAEQRRDWAEVVRGLTTRLELTPKNAAARQRLGVALFHQGKRDQGEDEILSASRQDNTLEPAPLLVARLYTAAGNIDRAARWIEYGIQQGPKDIRLHLGKTRWLVEQNRLAEAQQALEAAVRLDSKSYEVQGLRGLIARGSRDYSTAEQVFQTLQRERPEDFVVSNQLALVWMEQKDEAKRKKALGLAEANVRRYPYSSEALATLGQVYYRLGRADEAEKALRAAFTGKSGSSDAAYYLARLLAERGQKEEAKRLLSRALGAAGFFASRKEAQAQLDQLNGSAGTGR
jgi:tetratricopeptide (TPR) repeat protein